MNGFVDLILSSMSPLYFEGRLLFNNRESKAAKGKKRRQKNKSRSDGQKQAGSNFLSVKKAGSESPFYESKI